MTTTIEALNHAVQGHNPQGERVTLQAGTDMSLWQTDKNDSVTFEKISSKNESRANEPILLVNCNSAFGIEIISFPKGEEDASGSVIAKHRSNDEGLTQTLVVRKYQLDEHDIVIREVVDGAVETDAPLKRSWFGFGK